MYEHVSYEGILQRMLDRVLTQNPDIDTREGSVIFNALAPAAAELQNLYIQLDDVLDQTFADTAMGSYLERRAAERGILPFPATRAILKGEFNLDVPVGSRFSLDDLNYIAVEFLSPGVFRMECESFGEVGNARLGTLVPIQYVNGLTTAKLTELLIPGEDRETTEALRKRYFASLDLQAYGGNIADYREKTLALNGVGGCKIYPVWNGGGTVKVVILDSTFSKPSEALVSQVQTQLDPMVNQGKGLGIAPIGHVVTVEGVGVRRVDVETEITLQTGWVWADLQPRAQAELDQYCKELAKNWAETEQLVVRISQIETRFLGLPGVLDIGNTALNGLTQNLVLEGGEIPLRGTLNG